MIRVLLSLFVLLTSISLGHTQEATQSDFDAIWNSKLELKNKLLQIDSLAGTLDGYFTDLPKHQVEKALKLAREQSLFEITARLELTLGIYYTAVDIIDTAQIFLERALAKFETLDVPEKKAQLHQELGWVYLLVPYYDKALEQNLQGLALYEQLGQNDQVARSNVDVAYVHLQMEDPQSAWPFLEKARGILETGNDSQALGDLYQRYISYYTFTKDTIKGLAIAAKAITVLETLEDKSYLSGAYISRGIFASDFGQFAAAEKDFFAAKKYAVSSGYLLHDIEANRELGNLYVKSGQYTEAIPYLQTIVDSYQKNGNNIIGDYLEMYESLAAAHAGLGNYEQAYYFQGLHETLEDSIYTMESNRNIRDMQTKYDTDKTQALLLQRQKELYYSLGFLGLLVLLAGVLWWAYATKRKQNGLLEKGNEEKAFLIKEIHHRVKNNLQVLSSLLSLQSDYIDDPNALDAVLEGRNRVQSMGLIHQKLYMGENLATVDMKSYVLDLTAHLLASFGMEERVQLQIESSVPAMDVDTAIPLGLIINELVTNSLKYAFPNNRKGKIDIQLWINAQKELCLKLTDDGNGVSAEVPQEQSTSFGTDLIKILSKKLKGIITVDHNKGYSTLIHFQRYNQKRG